MSKQKDHGPTIKNDRRYEALRDRGYSKKKSARIANTKNPGKKGGEHGKYEDWRKEALYDKAKEVGIAGRSHMNKKELIHALRNS